jgi:hypothetical protein
MDAVRHSTVHAGTRRGFKPAWGGQPADFAGPDVRCSCSLFSIYYVVKSTQGPDNFIKRLQSVCLTALLCS